MSICIECISSINLYTKGSGQKITLEKNVKQTYEEDSQTFKDICEEYKEIIGVDREENKKEHDKNLVKILVEETKKVEKENIDNFLGVWKKMFLGKAKAGVCEFAGAVINPADFSIVQIEKFEINVTTE